MASRIGHEVEVRLLLRTSKVDINSKNRQGLTPLWYATKKVRIPVMKLLLETGNVDFSLAVQRYDKFMQREYQGVEGEKIREVVSP